MRKLRIALVGAGRRSRGHLPVIAKLSDRFELAAVCDLLVENARPAGEAYGVPWYTDLRRMLQSEKPDVCDLTVPGEAHHVVAVPILEAGSHLLVETPLAITLPTIDLIVEAARRNRRKLEVAENVWRFPAERLKLKIIERGLVGEPLRGYCVHPTGGYHAANGARVYVGGTAVRAKGQVQQSDIPTLSDGPVTRRQISQEHWTIGVVEMDNGRLAVLEYGSADRTPLRRDAPRYLGFHAARGHAFSPTYGSAGTLYLVEDGDARAYPILEESHQVDGVSVPLRYRVETDPPVVYDNPYAEQRVTAGEIPVADELASIHRAVVEDVEPEYGALAGRHDQEIVIAINESARTGRTVDLPLRGVTGYEDELHAGYRAEFGCDVLDVGAALARVFPVR